MLFRTSLGFANPVRAGRPDEAIPSSPAASEGRVVVVTGLGIAAAVDAVDGRPVWVVRYDRDIVGAGRIGRLRTPSGESPRQSLFANEPPIAALGRAWLAPTDSSRLLCVHDRPRGPRRELLAWRRARLGDQFAGMAAEQVVGLHVAPASPPTLVVLGKPAATEADPPGPVVVGLDALEEGVLRWQAASGTGSGEPYGRGLLTEREVFVPTAQGIDVFDVVGASAGRHLATLDRSRLSAEARPTLPESAALAGALAPLPGLGLVAVDEAWVFVWARGP
jgi:hypothetical protein